ncbi:DUF5129 domain-containing protein [Brachybacterium sp. p3-SID957]|uniref:DUF5129 domain-containing protein n=1 Tax=Brachybacterium sp. p3-SID957 TaxID=2916049 RepID=UPI00223C12F6|nr:DUF5129 domain-containing protein [Brachybacterium sp. p3-SID957]MCT1776357.1 DUF5129 domain-containing protein [Brachybacterium sp. p3-SID957]
MLTPSPPLAAPSPPDGARPRPSVPPPSLLTLLVVALLMALSAALAPPAAAVPPSDVTIDDRADAVDDEALEDRLAATDFRREVDLAVLVIDVTELDIPASRDTALNDAVLAHAKQERPEWMDGDKWADGRVIIALDPENRILGTYGGEDVKLSAGGFENVQDEMRDPAQDRDWEGALVAGAEEYAKLLDQPWWQTTAAIGGALAALGTAAATALGIIVGRRNAHARVASARPGWDRVRAERAETEAAARTLPAQSPYAEAVLDRYQRYLTGIEKAEQLDQQIPATLPWAWGLRGHQRRASKDFSRQVERLDAIDDDVIAANDLLHRIGDWRSAWEREQAPLRDSLEAVEGALMRSEGDLSERSPEEQAAVDALREQCDRTEAEMNRLTRQLGQDEITPDTALEGLDTLTAELSKRAMAVRELGISRMAEDEGEVELLRDASVYVEDEEVYDRTLRARRHQRLVAGGGAGSDGADGYGTFWHISPILWLNTWHSQAADELESHRNPSGSSGASSVSGYSSSSFSGAGSSSRF